MEFYKVDNISENWALAYEKKSLCGELVLVVRFLDLHYNFDEVCGVKCQITSGSYYASSLIHHKGDVLCLDAGCPAWTVRGWELKLAKKLATEEYFKFDKEVA